jgi:hypothetical protein
MKDLDEELWKLGILAKTKHNEVAPAKHELAPIFTTANVATDHNQLTMEIMKKVATKHNLVCLLHEKPFAGVNGSGKHNNWSISTDTGLNLLEPGESPRENAQFLLFLAAIIKAVDEHQDLLRISVASAGNDHRLGANEAPPAIVSMFLGDELTGILKSIEDGSAYIQKDRAPRCARIWLSCTRARSWRWALWKRFFSTPRTRIHRDCSWPSPRWRRQIRSCTIFPVRCRWFKTMPRAAATHPAAPTACRNARRKRRAKFG